MTAAISSFIAPPLPQAAAMPAAPQQDNGFARMLSQRQAMAKEPAAQPSEPAKAAEQAEAPPHSTTRPQAAERQPVKADKPKQPAVAKPAQAAHEAPATDTAEAAAKDSEPVDPALAEWLAALNLPPATPPADAPALAAGGVTAKPEAEAETPAAEIDLATSVATQKRSDKPEAEPAERLHAARESREKPDAIAAETSHNATEWQAAVERAQAPAEAQARTDTPGIAALGAAAPATGAQRAEAAAPVAATVATPVTAPEFAQSLGMQVSVLARDGIQQAELHLNPAEMGPISVQIALDGTQAQVNFGADSAATRAIIEGGLPELAAALRDAGFTLSGGGVHSQARGRDEGAEGQGGDRRGGASSETEVTPQRITARVSAGGIDVYA
jgi:flagellar hook-length control protein FliK